MIKREEHSAWESTETGLERGVPDKAACAAERSKEARIDPSCGGGILRRACASTESNTDILLCHLSLDFPSPASLSCTRGRVARLALREGLKPGIGERACVFDVMLSLSSSLLMVPGASSLGPGSPQECATWPRHGLEKRGE